MAEKSEKEAKLNLGEDELYETPPRTSRPLNLSSIMKATTQSLSSMRANPFYLNCVRILNGLIADSEKEIKDTVLDLFLEHSISNILGLGLLQVDEIPDETHHELWGITTYRKAFKMMIVASRHE